MSVSDRWLLPDGVQDILPPAAARIEKLRRSLLDSWQRWGYQLIVPPMIEYLESLLTGTGNDLDLQTFKLTDQLTGRMMGIRADMTPQAARIDAHSLRNTGLTRLCYAGEVLHTRPTSLLNGRAPLQAGCELFGSADLSADLEVMDLMLGTLRQAGVEKVHLDLAHVAIYRELTQAAGLDAATEAAVFDAMRRKSIPELKELLGDAAEVSAAGCLLRLARLAGGPEVLAEARAILKGGSEALIKGLDELEQVADRVTARHPGVDIGFDFCELRGYNYHTGLVFAAYVGGHGQAVAQGGRYDAVGRDFGRARPATGFSADLRVLAQITESSEPATAGAIWAPEEGPEGLDQAVAQWREKETVIQALAGDDSDPKALGCDRELVYQDGQWQVRPLA
ncbi:ATP phosphoribosyltransferase regulatory subunit [Marinobacteraceae bacterium S3BR75-40.1]